MALQADEIRALVREKGWTFVEIAARWGLAATYMSRLVNQPHTRPAMYDDAFRGLPQRTDVKVEREPRHFRRKPKKATPWTVEQMFPVGRLFEALDSRLGPEEGSRLVVRQIEREGEGVSVRFTITSGESKGEELTLPMNLVQVHLQDIGLDAD